MEKIIIKYNHTYKYYLKRKFKNWNPDRYNWKFHSWELAIYCSSSIFIWWDANRFNWNHSRDLFNHCFDYKHVWRKDYYRYKRKEFEAMDKNSIQFHLFTKFKYWNGDKFNWLNLDETETLILNINSLKYKHKWYKDYQFQSIMWELEGIKMTSWTQFNGVSWRLPNI